MDSTQTKVFPLVEGIPSIPPSLSGMVELVWIIRPLFRHSTAQPVEYPFFSQAAQIRLFSFISR